MGDKALLAKLANVNDWTDSHINLALNEETLPNAGQSYSVPDESYVLPGETVAYMLFQSIICLYAKFHPNTFSIFRVNGPLARPGFDALGMSAPVLVQMNPNGQWESSKPGGFDEDRLKAVVQHLVNSKALSAAQSYCSQCAAENKNVGGKSNYVPVVMMPIYPADQCPFDMECEVQKMRESDSKPSKRVKENKEAIDSDKDKEKLKKSKKKGFVMQRLTDFDLLSQW